MKIAIVSTMGGAPWGGSEELWAATAIEALIAGHDVMVSAHRWPTMPAKILDLKIKGARISLRPFPACRRQDRLLEWLRPPFRALSRFRPDAVCVSQGGTYDAVHMPLLLDFVRALSVPYVVVCQFNCDRDIPSSAARQATLKFLAHAYRVGFVSRANTMSAERQLASALPNAVVLRNPVNLSDLSAVTWPSSPTVRMASVARLEARYKGQDILFEALSSETWRGRDWKLCLFGQGPDRQYLNALARHYKIAEHLEFRGHVGDVRAIWAENHLLVLPSRAEGTPLALVEAMVCGRPAVVTDVGGNTEWVTEPDTGFIATVPNARSIGDALARAWLLQAEWQAIGREARATALSKYDRTPGQSLLNVIVEAFASRLKGRGAHAPAASTQTGMFV